MGSWKRSEQQLGGVDIMVVESPEATMQSSKAQKTHTGDGVCGDAEEERDVTLQMLAKDDDDDEDDDELHDGSGGVNMDPFSFLCT